MRRAFSLIEMMVVITIILILAALTLGISNSVLRGSEIRRTRDALSLLTLALDEWELEMGRSMTSGLVDVGLRYDIDDASAVANGADFMSQVSEGDMVDGLHDRMVDAVNLMMQSEAAASILTRVNPDLISRHVHPPGTAEDWHIRDAWDNPMGLVLPGEPWKGSPWEVSGNTFVIDASGDGTIWDQGEDGLGSCVNRKPYWVSAGPDETFGFRYESRDGDAVDEDRFEAALDNLYSYDVFIVEGAR